MSRKRKTPCDSEAIDHHFKEGDLVWVCNPKQRRDLSLESRRNYKGPNTVIKKLTDVVYRVQRSPKAKLKVIHFNQPAPYRATNHTSA
ncbi:unnamed protein product [Larinioides sclopetarius]|uniref:Integrase p58-like C-terminal domain-containing protein n=1 Tax=Larinioides sclopetarius TaxID=280406 RepID=A0AAV1ZP35_9ARAC